MGRVLVKKLTERGEKVKLLVRNSSPLDGLEGNPHISFINGELTSKEDIHRGLEDCSMVIHAAALVKTWVPKASQFDEVNIRGLKAVMAAAMERNIQKICYISSFIALGPTDGQTADEATPYPMHGWHNDYERTKYLADLEIKEFIEKGLPAITLYPGVIYGPGRITGGNIVVSLIADFNKGKIPGILGDGLNKWSYAYVEDVADGIICALDRGKIGERYILGGENCSMEKFFETMSGLLHRKKPSLRIPYWAAKFVGAGEELLGMLTGREPKNTRGTIEIFKHEWSYNSDKAKKELGYRYRSLSEGLTLTVNWMKENGLL